MSEQPKTTKRSTPIRILPRQLEFDNDIPSISGNADYAAENRCFDKAARLFAADKPVVFRLTEKVAVQERAMVALRVAILRKHTG